MAQQYFKYSFLVTGSGGTYTLGAKAMGPTRAYYIRESSDNGGDSQTQVGDIANDRYQIVDSNNGAGGTASFKGVFLATAPNGNSFVGSYNGPASNPADFAGAPRKYLYTNNAEYATGQTISGFSSARAVTLACYVTGTLIRTVAGDVAVEALAIDDLVTTASGAARPIKWIGRRSYAGRFVNANPDALPVCFKPGSLADGVPARDLSVSPKHAMFLDGVLIQAQDLVNGVSVVRADKVDEVTYWHVELDSHDVLLAENAPSESFVDDDSRAMFHNVGEFAALYPDETPVEAIYCAPRVQDGYTLDAVRRRIDARAGLVASSHDRGALYGAVELRDGETVSGWAQSAAHPDAPVCLDIVVDGVVAGQTLANRFSPILLARGVGDGRHAFEWRMPVSCAGTSPTIEVRRSIDGLALDCSAVYDDPQTSVAA